jgi:hypothetical protein
MGSQPANSAWSRSGRSTTPRTMPPGPPVDHIRGTPGFAGWGWPHEMSQADNLRDLQRHAQDFAGRRGFTYTVLSAGTGDVIGCVYIYPHRGDGPGGTEAGRHAVVRSWVRADRAALDPVLYHVVLAWLERDWWPFHSIEYAPGHALLSITWELPHGLRCARTSVSGWSASRNPQTSPSRRTARRAWCVWHSLCDLGRIRALRAGGAAGVG